MTFGRMFSRGCRSFGGFNRCGRSSFGSRCGWGGLSRMFSGFNRCGRSSFGSRCGMGGLSRMFSGFANRCGMGGFSGFRGNCGMPSYGGCSMPSYGGCSTPSYNTCNTGYSAGNTCGTNYGFGGCNGNTGYQNYNQMVGNYAGSCNPCQNAQVIILPVQSYGYNQCCG